jgi:hypothetical protein
MSPASGSWRALASLRPGRRCRAEIALGRLGSRTARPQPRPALPGWLVGRLADEAAALRELTGQSFASWSL